MMRLRKLSVPEINPAPYNPRKDLKPDDPEYQRLVRSLDEFGCVEPLIWNQRTGNLVGGHQRFKVLVAQGARQIDVSVVDLPLDREKALNIALNKVVGEWDQDKLTSLLAELHAVPQFDVELTGFDLPDVEQLLAEACGDTGDAEQFDVTNELAQDVPTVTKRGELLELGLHGEHRVLCGDATKAADLRRLMGDRRAALCHTDPPYGVNYDRRNRPANKTSKTALPAAAIANDDLTPKQYRRWFAKVVAVITDSLPAGAPFYFWNSHKNFGMMHDLLTEHGCKVAAVITWGKESFSPGFGDYNEQVEYCLYGWKGGARHRWYGPKNASTLWQVRRDRTHLYRHPTQKPLELAERAVRHSSKAGDVVLDVFLGSGTTLIAAARLGRRCFGMEIDPRYCDCIVRRYIALAGARAVSTTIAERYRLEAVPA